jgi:hypothetical protein
MNLQFDFTLLDLRIELETLLADYLGQYTLANGVTTPALAVRENGESFQPGTKVDGIEVVIVREPDLIEQDQYRNKQALREWVVFLVDWGKALYPLTEIAELILYNYPSATARTLSVPRGLGPEHQMQIRIRTNPRAI